MTEFVVFGMGSFIPRFLILAVFFGVALGVLEFSTNKPLPLNRFWFGIIYILVAVSLTVFPSVFVTVASNNIETAAIIWLGCVAMTMAILAYSARRRAVDAYGDTYNAFYAIVPIICLALIFRKPEDVLRLEERKTAAFVGRITLFILCAATFLIFGSFLKGLLDAVNKNRMVSVASLPLDSAIKVQAALLDADTPQFVDSETTLMSVSERDNELVLGYVLTGESANFTPAVFEAVMRPIVRKNVCSLPVFRDLMDRGATITFKYDAIPKSAVLQRYRLQASASDC